MKIAYWSNSRKSGVTSNLAAVSLTGVLAYPFKITMFENHYNANGISKYIFPECMSKGVAEQEAYCLGHRVFDHPACRRNEKAFRTYKDYAVVEAIEDSLYYVPQIAQNAELFDFDFQCRLLPVLNSCAAQNGIAFIDTSLENSISSKIILNEADFVVVTLRQDLQDIHDFFQNYSSLSQKAFFIIGNYNKKSKISLKAILSEFEFQRDRIGIIPHSDEFQMASESGRMIEFISSHFHPKHAEEEKYFIQQLKRTTFLLMQHTVFNRKKAGSFEF